MTIISRKTTDPIVIEKYLKPKGTLVLESRTRDGLVSKRKEYPMDSMTQNYWRGLATQIGSHPLGAGHTSTDVFVRLSGTSAGLSNGVTTGAKVFGVSDVGSAWGMRVGTGNTPVKIGDQTLDSIIGHGSESGELHHLETYGFPSEENVVFSRAFENLSGATITIRELGVMLRRSGDPDSATSPYMFARDVLPEPFYLVDDEVLTASGMLYASEGTRNMHRAWEAMTRDSGNWYSTFIDTENEERTLGAWIQDCNGSAGDGLRGIMLGTGAENTPSKEDYDLEERLSQGDGSGQLMYGNPSPQTWVIDDTEMSWETRRTILNDSGEDYMIKEMGLFGSNGTWRFLYDRFLLPNPIKIKDGTNREARWRFLYQL